MPEPIALGTQIEILEAGALLLNGEHFTTSNPAEFAERLIRAYEHEDPEELPQREGWMRAGYQFTSLMIQPVSEDPFQPKDPFTLYMHAYQCYDKWPEYGGPDLIGDPDLRAYSESKWNYPVVCFPGHTGKEFGERMMAVIKGRTVVLIEIRHTAPGPLAHTDYAALIVEPCEGMIAKGTIHLLRHHGDGDTWSMLYKWEGRGDHEF